MSAQESMRIFVSDALGSPYQYALDFSDAMVLTLLSSAKAVGMLPCRPHASDDIFRLVLHTAEQIAAVNAMCIQVSPTASRIPSPIR